MADNFERHEAARRANHAGNSDRGKSHVIAAFAWPVGRCNWSNNEIVPKKHEQTFQKTKKKVHWQAMTPKLNAIILGDFWRMTT